jgi:hypothetical protein
VIHREGGPAPTIADDSAFPLQPEDAAILNAEPPLDRMLAFRGDGLEFSMVWGGNDDASEESLGAMDRMIRTIRFQPWESDDVRNGFTPVGVDFPWGRGEVGFIRRLGLIYTMKIRDLGIYVIDVPDVSCEGQNQTWDASAEQILLEGPCYGDIRYDLDGRPDPGNPAEYQKRLDKHPVIRAWDGSRLVALEVTFDAWKH